MGTEPAAKGLGYFRRRPHGGVSAGNSSGRALLSNHWPFLLVFGAGAALRVAVSVAYAPALEFVQDSFSYLEAARNLHPDVIRPVGYSFFLRLLSFTHTLAIVPAVQHLLGLGAGIIVYAVLRRFRANRWLAAMGAAPILLDGYQINIEQFVLAETLFEFLVVAAIGLLLLQHRPGVVRCAVVAAMLGAAAVTRTVGLPLLVLVIVYLLIKRVRPAALLSAAAIAVLILGGYMTWFRSANGHLGFESFTGYFLAGRVSSFADCGRIQLAATERHLCDLPPRSQRLSSAWYIWSPDSPLRDPVGPSDAVRERTARDFAIRVVRHQPGDAVLAFVADMTHYFGFGRTVDGMPWDFPLPHRLDPWVQLHPPTDPYIFDWTWPGNQTAAYGVLPGRYDFALARVEPADHPRLSRTLHDYQSVAYVQGPVLALALLVIGVAGFGRLRVTQRPTRSATLFLAAVGLTLIGVPAATATFDYRYALPAEPLIVAGGIIALVLGCDRVRDYRRGRAADAGTVLAGAGDGPGSSTRS